MSLKLNRSALTGAAFLMATSAIGPGFLTQTAYYTWQLAASFGFVILVSAAIFVAIGKPVQLLVLAGTINGFILPLALGLFLTGVHRQILPDGYRHPNWLTAAGWLVTTLMAGMAIWSLF